MKILIAGELNPDLILRDYEFFPEPGKEVLVEDLQLIKTHAQQAPVILICNMEALN